MSETEPHLAGVKVAAEIESEMFVVGAMMSGKNAIETAMSILDFTDLYRPMNQSWFRAITNLHERKEPTDYLAFQTMATSDPATFGGLDYFLQLFDYASKSVAIEHYAKKVRAASMLRQYQAACFAGFHADPADIENAEEYLEEQHRKLYQLASRCVTRGLRPIKESVQRLDDLYMARMENPVQIAGISTGFPAIDLITEGLKPGEYCLIAGRPSMGKTSLALKIAYNVASSGIPVAIFSYEMQHDDLTSRLVCSEAQVSKVLLETGTAKRHEFDRAIEELGKIYELPIRVDDDAHTNVMQMGAKCRQMKMDGGLGLVVVDYIGLIKGNSKYGKREELDAISRDLKLLAMELQVPFIVLSQLSRACETRENKRPMLSDLRDSGSLEQDADLVWFVYRDGHYKRDKTYNFDENGNAIPEQAEAICAKHRNGPIGTAFINWTGQFARFTDPSELVMSGPTGF